MRDTIDFGIDLGTTNSAIAVVQDGDVLVIKNNDGWDYTPSAVWIPKAGVMNVGRSARDRIYKGDPNAHAEFKAGAAGTKDRSVVVGALEAMVRLYDDWGKKDEADAWRKALAEAKAAK